MSRVAAVKVDYYELLGVSRDADREAIRSAFHAAVRDGDPDLADEPDGEARLRELAEAYSVLARTASRLLYDRNGYRGRGNTGFDEALWDARRRDGDTVEVPVTLRERDALRGISKPVKYEAAQRCHACEGRGTAGAVDPDCPSCGGTGRRSHVSDEDHAQLLRVEPCPICGGQVCSACGGSGREPGERLVRVRFPAGIEHATLLRVEGEGDVGERGGAPGDLLLDVTVLPESQDSRLVRYTALALCLAAIALLVAYVLFQ
jgi:molecular chaperone DnaJ